MPESAVSLVSYMFCNLAVVLTHPVKTYISNVVDGDDHRVLS